MSRRVLVTGASGFIGRPLVASLLAAGHDVHATGRGDPLPGVTWHAGDLLDCAGPSRMLAAAAPDTLVHLAWCTDPARYREDPANSAWAQAGRQLLRDFAAAGGRRAVFAGTVMEYAATAALCVEGTTPLEPQTLYGECKAQLGSFVESTGAGLGVSCAWARLFWMYGPGEAPGRLVSSLAAGLLAGRRVALGEGVERRDYLHVHDVAGALAATAVSDVEGPVNIGAGEAVSVAEIATRIGALLGRPDLVGLGERPPSPGTPPAPVICADVGRLRDEVGFRPRLDLDSGLRETVDWWRAGMPG